MNVYIDKYTCMDIYIYTQGSAHSASADADCSRHCYDNKHVWISTSTHSWLWICAFVPDMLRYNGALSYVLCIFIFLKYDIRCSAQKIGASAGCRRRCEFMFKIMRTCHQFSTPSAAIFMGYVRIHICGTCS